MHADQLTFGIEKALTIDAPWAWLIVNGYKTVENRTWRTNHRGQLAIHAGMNPRSDELVARVCSELGIQIPEDWTPYRGCVLGFVNVVDVVPAETLESHPFVSGPHCWKLEQPTKFPHPIPAQGQQGLWNWEGVSSASKARARRL